jgi:hypothetical protein
MSMGGATGLPSDGTVPAPAKREAMNSLIRILARPGLLKGDLDLHLVRGSMVVIFLLIGYQNGWDPASRR